MVVMLSIFPYTFWPFELLLWKNKKVHSNLQPIFKSDYKFGFGFGFGFLLLSCGSSYVLEINSLSNICFTTIFSHSIGCLFTLWIVSFAVQNLTSLSNSNLSIFVLVSLPFGPTPMKSLPKPVSCTFSRLLLAVVQFIVLHLNC